jgi:serine/threonine protein kinase
MPLPIEEPQSSYSISISGVHFSHSCTYPLFSTTTSGLYPGTTSRLAQHHESIDTNPALPVLPKQKLESTFCPLYDGSCMTLFTGNVDSPAVFKKEHLLLGDPTFAGKEWIYWELTRREVLTGEKLRMKPHENVCAYLGCVTTRPVWGNNERVTGIAYEWYDMDLAQFARLRGLRESEADGILENVRRGMQHLHSLNLVHCDLRPENIFLRLEIPEYNFSGGRIVKAVLGDFDAVVGIGEARLL